MTAVLVGLLGTLSFAVGLIALLAPVGFVKLHNRISGELAHPWYRSRRYDPEAVRHSRTLRSQYRLVGAILVALGGLAVYLAWGR